MAFELTWAMLFAVVGLIVAGIAQSRKGNADTRKKMTWFGIIILAVGVIAIAGIIPQFSGLNSKIDLSNLLGQNQTTTTIIVQGGQAGTGATTGSGLCAVEDTTVTLSSTDKYSSAAAGTSHRYRINNGPAVTVSNAGTFTASPGDSVQVLFGNNSDGSYFGSAVTEVIPCAGTVTITDELVANGTLTINVFNEEGNLISSLENETLAAGDVVTLKAELKGQYQHGFPYGGVLIIESNKSYFDDLIADFGGTSVSVPSVYSPLYGSYARTRAYSVPAILSNQILQGTITLDVSTNDPAATPYADVNVTFMPYDYYIDDDNGGAFAGPSAEDEDFAQTFGHITESKIEVD